MAKDETGKWAVENTNLDTGETVRYMETSQDWVAKSFAERANAAFAKSGVRAESSAVRL